MIFDQNRDYAPLSFYYKHVNHISSAPTVHVTAVAVNKENLALWTREPVLMDARRGGQGDFVILVYQFTYSIEE